MTPPLTPERWQRTEELYHAARAISADERAAFLVDACRGDEALRHDVESLLHASRSDDSFLAAPPLGAAARLIADSTHGPLAGRALAGYFLHSPIGAGGMGEVYRARDASLGRDVAIKILPKAFTTDPDRLARFEREARLLAALNHPNICAIYGVEDAEGIRFLVLELVDGETLAERISRNETLSTHEAVAFARQIAEGLEAAHEKGIIHRDLKPANIKITPQGVVKVLDFGLAKDVAGNGSSPDLTRAPAPSGSEGREDGLLGTAAYMSPEQARGKVVDKRTDIWAFGCVLYEMLTGRVAFGGETVSDTIGKILEREPEWSRLPPSTPPAVRRVLRRCLEKDAKRRFRDIGDVRIDLHADAELAVQRSDVKPAIARAATIAKWLPLLALAALLGAGAQWQSPRPVPDADPLARATFLPFTDWAGTEAAAEISPDGRFVAFLADRDGHFDLWLSQIGTGRFVNLTRDMPPMAAPGVILRSFGFSGDGADLWYSEANDPGERKLLLPLSGGRPRAFLPAQSSSLSWSPDGSAVVYFNNGGGDPLFVAQSTGADPRRILGDADGLHNHNPVWSPDGQWIYLVRGSEPTDNMDVWRVRPSGDSPERLTRLNGAVNFLAPLDSRTLLYIARAADRSGPWLWSLDVERKLSRRVISGLEQYTSVSVSRDGRRAVTTVAHPTVDLWRLPILDRIADDRDARPYALPAVRARAPRFGGSSLFYLSAGGAGDGLWRLQDGESSEVWKGGGEALSEPPAVSRVGQRLAVVTRQAGKRHIVIMSADGTQARTLAASIDIQGAAGQASADWSPDGKWIVTGGRDNDGAALFLIPVDGSAPVRLVEGYAQNPLWSPNGEMIVYSSPLGAGGQADLRAVRPDGRLVRLPQLRVRQGGYRFLPDGTGLVYLPRNQSLDFWLFDLSTGTSKPLTRLSNQGRILTFDVTPNGKEIVFDRSRENSDIVLINLPK